MTASTTRRGGWIQTYSNTQFWPLDARPEDVRLVDIAHALSHLCRFAGHCEDFYSVAQHSVHVADAVWNLTYSPALMRAALLHDATEAYLVDVPSPIKGSLTNYKKIEAALAGVIGTALDAQLEPLDDIIKHEDLRALATEKRDLRGPEPAAWQHLPPPWAGRIQPWTSKRAKEAFLHRARLVGIRTTP